MAKYNNIGDMFPVVEKIMAAYNDPDKLGAVFELFIKELMADYGSTDQAVKYYVSVMALLDGHAGTTKTPIEMTRAIYDGIIKSHVDVLRRECVKHRQNVNFTSAQIAKMADVAMAHTSPADCGQIMGIRKTTRVSPSVGVFSAWLTEDDMHAAAMSVCAWVPHPTSVIDGGFIAGYSNKFDFQEKGILRELTDKIDTDAGLTPAEYKTICGNLVPQVLKVLGDVDGTAFLETVFKKALERIDEDTVKQLLTPYAIRCGLNIKVTSKAEWSRVFLTAKRPFPRGWSEVPASVGIEYGMELCYPIAPLLSWIWVEEMNQLSGKKAIKHRFGYVDVDSLFHSKYNTRSAEGDDGINRGYGLFPMLSCSFIAAPNIVCAEKISGCAENNVMLSAYTWKASATDDDQPVFYNLDDLFAGKIFAPAKKYSLDVDMRDSVCLPGTAEAYTVESPDTKTATFPKQLVADGDFVTIVFASGNNSESQNWGWGQPLSKGSAQKILPFLEFNHGQELDTNERKKTRTICRVTTSKSNAVINFLANVSKKYVLFKTPNF
jgi:hypothetical protein